MLIIDKILVLGANERASKIVSYLTSVNYSVTQGSILRDQDYISLATKELQLKDMKKFDLVILAGVSKIFNKDELRVPKFGFLTCHAGLVPEYRGSSPLSWSIINDEQFFGLTVLKTSPDVDRGEIYCSARFDIQERFNIADLHYLANTKFPYLVHTAILNIINDIPAIEQISTSQCYYPLRHNNDSEIFFAQMSAKYIKKLFRSLNPRYPNPFFTFKNKKVSFEGVETKETFHGTPGKVYQIDGDRILVACKYGAVWLILGSSLEISRYEHII